MFNRASDFARYLDAGALDIIQPDACVLPGPAAALAATAAAGKHGAGAILHGWAGPVAQMQNIHAALASANCDRVEFCPLLHPLLSDGLAPVWNFNAGRLAAPQVAGMGAAPIEALAAKYPFKNVSMLIA
jgi:L-alanine-DL-glutamate epimerase-like enolase superfamily enzyme